MAYPISKHISIGDAASRVIRARPSHVKDIIDGKLDKRKKGTFGPPFGKRRGVSHMAFCYDGGTPIAGWFIMEHPKLTWMIWGYPQICQKGILHRGFFPPLKDCFSLMNCGTPRFTCDWYPHFRTPPIFSHWMG